MQSSCGLARSDGCRARKQYRPSVEPGFHLHDRYTALGIAGSDRALDRRGAAPTRQQRRMNVDAPQSRRLQNSLRKQQSVRGDDHEIG